ncbi:MAG: hypothetical protein HN712_01085 [Gemmatimonadetes bacterium]|nr:hypothetical protein [Gemmatimonadota bacterium]MBT6144504.1 hypothetical protein [Gemmatimonadota bacterium]MBT7858865.1 hypothetical protein [Gemmatimonadota bacterium]
MNLEFDEEQYPELTAFRKACLAGRYEEMKEIAGRGHSWYENENPDDTSMERLATIFQAQYHANCGNLDELQRLILSASWVVNEGWTAQGWLPITQAASTHGARSVIDLLIEAGADLSLMVGDEDDRASIPDMARAGGHPDLAIYLAGE